MLWPVQVGIVMAQPSDSVSQPTVAAIKVEIIDAPVGADAVYQDIAHNLIQVSENQPFSNEKLQQSLDALKQSQRFQKIHADSQEDESGLKLLFQLTPFRQIKNIRIQGASPLFNADVLKVMTIDFGQNFDPKQLEEQPRLIEKLYRREGFINPRVEASDSVDPKDGQAIVHIQITPGPYYKIKRFEIYGDHPFSEMMLRLRLKTYIAFLLPWEAGRFIPKNVKTDIKSIIEYARGKGFADVKADCVVGKTPELNQVSLFFKIEAGPRYDVDFDGNTAFWDYTLKKDLALFDKGNLYGRGVAKSLENIKQRYIQAGFREIEVDAPKPDPEAAQEPEREITLRIDEGPQTIVHRIEIHGNHYFDDERIAKQMLTRTPNWLHDGAFTPSVLDDDLTAISALYHQHGFQKVAVDKAVTPIEEPNQVDVAIQIDEGVQTWVASTTVTFTRTDADKPRFDADMISKLQLQPGEPFNPLLLEEDVNTVAALVSEQGYPHAAAKANIQLNDDHSLVQITHHVDQGPYTTTGNIYFSGNFLTRRHILANELEVRPDDPFSLQKILKTEQNIRALTCIDGVHIRQVGFKERAPKVHLFAEIEEKAPYYIQSGVGYDTMRLLYIESKAGNRNLLGANINGMLELEASQIGFLGDLKFTEPRLFGSRVASILDIYWKDKKELNQKFGLRNFGSSLKFSRQWMERLFVDLTFLLEYREQFRSDPVAEAEAGFYDADELEDPRQLFSTKPALRYDGRDSFVRPRRGVYASVSADISTGLENSLDDFIRYELDARYYFTPWERLTLAWLARIGYIDPYGDIQKAPDDQLFFMGGARSIRGYKENLFRYDTQGDPLGGELAMIGSVEARIEIGMNLEFTVFYDIGRLTDTIEEDPETFRSAVGLGLRYITPIGPIGFLYGFKLDPREDEDLGRLYFSIGYTF